MSQSSNSSVYPFSIFNTCRKLYGEDWVWRVNTQCVISTASEVECFSIFLLEYYTIDYHLNKGTFWGN